MVRPPSALNGNYRTRIAASRKLITLAGVPTLIQARTIGAAATPANLAEGPEPRSETIPHGNFATRLTMHKRTLSRVVSFSYEVAHSGEELSRAAVAPR